MSRALNQELRDGRLCYLKRGKRGIGEGGLVPSSLQTVHDLTSFTETQMTNFIEQAKDRGKQEGLAHAALRLLSGKFEGVSEDVRARVLAGDVDQLGLWIDRVLTADSVEEVFRDDSTPS